MPYDKCCFCTEVFEALLISKSHTVLDKDLNHISELGFPPDTQGKGVRHGAVLTFMLFHMWTSANG